MEYIRIPGILSRINGGTNIKINLAGVSPRSSVNGPGLRGVIWVQGCPVRCPGCFNTEFQEFRPRHITDVDTLTEYVRKLPGIEGVTFSGGEPFAQAEALSELGENLQGYGLNVVTFSGFSYPYLRSKNRKSWRSLLHVTDLLIAGPYIAGETSNHPLLASSNQSMEFLSDRLKGRLNPNQSYQEIELIFDPGNDVKMTGFPDRELCHHLKDILGYDGGDMDVALQQD